MTVQPNEALGDLVVGTFSGAGDKQALLVGHMDTVFDAGTVAARPFTAKMDGQRGRASTT